MKKLGNKVLKFLFYLTYPLILIALLVSVVWNFLQYREIKEINDTFLQAQEELNEVNQDATLTIDDLRTRFEELNQEVADLRAANEALTSELAELESQGIGRISGKLLPFSDLGQFQRICARLISNNKLQFCRTVSALDALDKNYVLSLPAGEYQVYAEPFPLPAPDEAGKTPVAFYDKYVVCVKEKSAAQCNENDTEPVTVVVKTGEVTTNINPVNWR